MKIGNKEMKKKLKPKSGSLKRSTQWISLWQDSLRRERTQITLEMKEADHHYR